MRHPEAALQRQIVGYLTWALAPPAMFTSFPAGGGGQMRGMILKGTGLRAGMPDLMFLYDSRTWFIELKTEKDTIRKVRKGVLSKVQKDTHADLLAARQVVETARNLDEVKELLALWAIPTRETKPATERIKRGMTAALKER
jgi:hypothetical protein